ncbi:uncharacterized protein DNG_07272 [Cephalotrichum gorgonifer]|uniref:Uncharacterized protein n=1 Tax=Cephalotrichum gorgonifer TaxID=2041049 RepID=A0AAE8N492_9PEZI|nr:uncharacterized protein DNG_07272 [Cephalotrichum gorgonifer]
MDVDALDRILKERGIDVSRSQLSGALRDASFSAWAKLHLTPATMLTQDELSTFTALSSTGAIKRLKAGLRDQDLPLPRSQQELQSAIRELNRSAAAISKQTETLRQQQEALARFARARIGDEERRSELEATRMHRTAVETREVKASVEDLSRSLDVKLSELEQQSQAADDELRRGVDELLHSDDKLLASLEKLGAGFNLTDRRDDDLVDGVRETCMKLIKCTVEMTRCRLDRTYLEALNNAVISDPKHSDTTDPAEVSALREEVDSLYAEILPVVQMSVENQYLQPAVRKVTNKNARALEHSSVAVDYVNDCLDYLQSHTTALLSRLETLHSHQSATSTIAAAARAELSKPVTKPRPRRPSNPNRSPVRRRKSKDAISPARQRAPSLRRRRSSSIPPDEPALESLLRALSLSGSLPEGGRERVAALEEMLAEKEAKARGVAAGAQGSFEEAVRMHLHDAQRAVGLLWGCVLADSPYGEVRLVDEEVEGSIGVMEREAEAVRGRLGEVEPRGARVRGEKRAELLRRWGGE